MITFFRRFITSPFGIAVFAIVLLAFVITLYEGKSGFNLASVSGGSLATVGGEAIGEGEAVRRTQTQLQAAQQQAPGMDMAAFVAQGGADQTIEQMINGRALETFAATNGLVASRKLVDGAIASISAFNGPDGKFDRTTFLGILAQRKIPENQLRADFGREAVTKALLIPAAGASRVPVRLVEPYAALLLEARTGLVGVVPTTLFANGAAPSPADLATFYSRNVARYTVPERRTVKYAIFDRSRFDGKVKATDSEIEAIYRASAAKYAARETRSFTQIIVPQAAQAEALAARIRGGMPMTDAARSAGLAALTVPATDGAAFEKLTGPSVAKAAFAAPKGSIAPIVQSGLGFHIVRVDAIIHVAARPLSEVRGEISAALDKVKIDEAIADLVAKVDGDAGDGATFDEVVKKYGLTGEITPAITVGGQAPDQPGYRAPPQLGDVLKEAFQAETSDDPAVAAVAGGTSYVLYHLDGITPSAPRPLAQIRDQVVADAQIDRASKAAKRVADAVAAKVNGGMPFAEALAGAGVKLPAPQPAGGKRIDIARSGNKVPPPLALLFSMAEKRAKVIAVPQGAGWYIVYLDNIQRGDARQAQPLIAATQSQLSRVVGDEYVGQFVNAIKAQVGVKRNDSAIARFKAGLAGGSGSQ